MDARTILKEYHIGCTQPRIAIMDYLMKNHTHPTVDIIYCALIDDNPTLSRTTVYNTVKLLAEHGVVSLLSIDDKNICVDADITPHAHLQCKNCGKIIDIPMQQEPPVNVMVDGNIIEEVHQYYRGRCKSCVELENARPISPLNIDKK